MKEHILQTFKKANLLIEENDYSIASIIDKEHQYAVFVDRESNRVPDLTILMTQDGMEQIGEDFELPYNAYGEIPLLRLFNYLLEHEDETWIVDTDILNWNITVGGFRDLDEVIDSEELGKFNSLEALNEIFGDKEHGMPMVFVLHVQLRDYMS